MFVASFLVSSPCSESSHLLYNGFSDPSSSRSTAFKALVRSTSRFELRRLKKGRKSNAHFDSESSASSPVLSSLVAYPAEEIASPSMQKVYNVVLKQAALLNEQSRSAEALDVRPNLVSPGTLSLLGEAYDRCRGVCAEYAKTFYLGTLLMTPERRKAI